MRPGYLPIYVDSTFFPNVPVGTNRIWSAYLGITSNETSNVDGHKLPPPAHFTLQGINICNIFVRDHQVPYIISL